MNIAHRFAWVRAVIAAQPRPTLAEAAVAVVLAEHYNHEKGAAWPAQNTMAELLGRSRRTVRLALAALENRGLIQRVRDGGPKSSAAFALVMPPDGAPSRHQMASRPAISGRPVPPSDGAPSRHEQVGTRSEAVVFRNPAAGARSAVAARARGGRAKTETRRRPVDAPTTL